MKTTKTLLLVLGFLALFVAAGFFVQRRLGDRVNLPPLAKLLKTQDLMPDMELPTLGQMPEIAGISQWLNGNSVKAEDLRGKVVLVDFMTYSCINCIRTFPYLNAWHEKYRKDGLVVIGIHTPEFDFEKDPENVRKALADYMIRFRVALDNDYVTWRNFQNRFWPAEYLFDQEGRLRYVHFGEGDYDKTESAIQQLLGSKAAPLEAGTKEDFAARRSPETYFGYGRAERFGGPGSLPWDRTETFAFPKTLEVDQWALEGTWTVAKTFSTSGEGETRLRFHYAAGNANVVLDTPDRHQTRVDVSLDGAPIPEALRGKDIRADQEGNTYLYAEFPQLYEITRGPWGDHMLEFTFNKPGVKAYSITFGVPETSEAP